MFISFTSLQTTVALLGPRIWAKSPDSACPISMAWDYHTLLKEIW